MDSSRASLDGNLGTNSTNRPTNQLSVKSEQFETEVQTETKIGECFIDHSKCMKNGHER